MICLEGIVIRSKSARPSTLHRDTICAKLAPRLIGIDHLLAALDRPSCQEEELAPLFEQVPENGGGFFHNTEWMRLSNGVVAAITPIGGFEGIAKCRSAWQRPD
jgi:hypothetical protein